MSYEYDVFVSYRRNTFLLEWVGGEFIGPFCDRLESILGYKPAIFWDHLSVSDGQIAKARVLKALLTSRCIVPVMTQPYFASAWCSAEWNTFYERATLVGLAADGNSLTLPIRLQDGERYLPLIRGEAPQPRDFTRFRLTGEGWRKTPTHADYQMELDGLAESTAALIDSAPPFDPAWTIVDPDTLGPRQAPPEIWPYKLSGMPKPPTPAPITPEDDA